MNTTNQQPRRGMRRMVAAVVVAVASTAALSVWAAGGHGGGHGTMGAGMMIGSPERLGRMVDRMLDGLNATDQQRAQIKQIAEAAASDLRGQHEQQRALRERATQVFTAPTVDANAAEQVRQQMLAQHDARSKRMTAALIEVSRVLTPEQRAKVAERMAERQSRMKERMDRMQRQRPQQ